MSLHLHKLAGCAPAPLAHYLKALGILRLVAEQKDSAARGFWKNEAFHLVTKLNEEELEKFFLEEYQPTPMIAPWNGGSGFYPKDNKDGFQKIISSSATRLAPYKMALTIGSHSIGKWEEAPEKKEKEKFIASLSRNWRGGLKQWITTALIIDGQDKPQYPSLLGTGGNDGRLDFTNNFMQRFAEVFDLSNDNVTATAIGRVSLTLALWGEAKQGLQANKAVGQFLPGGAGGANSTTGSDGKSQLNPFDFILMMEGCILLASQATKQLDGRSSAKAAAPFATHAATTGYISTSIKEKDARGEQWMPLWTQATSLHDLQHLLSEGRVQKQQFSASRPIDFARAIARLGVAKGIDSFQRFGYLERNGQANLAIPLGRWRVTAQPNQELLNDLDSFTWLDRLQRCARDDKAPASFAAIHHRLEEAVMGVCRAGQQADRWQVLLVAIGEMEGLLVRSGSDTAKHRQRPIPPLSAGWVKAADDGSAEFRLALSLSLQAEDSWGRNGIRRHWMPLDKFGRNFAKGENGLAKDPAVVCQGLDPERDLLALLERRLIEGSKDDATRLPLVAAQGTAARLGDLSALLKGELDLDKILSLARPLMALDRRDRNLTSSLRQVSRATARASIDPLYALFRLAALPWDLPSGSGQIAIRCDPATIRRLAAGDLASAADSALRRLKASGLFPVIRHASGDATLARRLALALAFPIAPKTAEQLALALTKNTTSQEG